MGRIGDFFRNLSNSFFWGLRSADERMLGQTSVGSEPDSHVEQKNVQQSVYNDLLEARETEEVQEFRDKYYRVYKESGKYKGDLVLSEDDSEEGYHFKVENIRKEEPGERLDLFPSLEGGDEGVFLIQRQGAIGPTISETIASCSNGIENPHELERKITTNITLGYGPETVSMRLDKAINMVSARKTDGMTFLDIYFKYDNLYFDHNYAISFGKLRDIVKNGTRYDFIMPEKVDFITENAYGAEDLCRYTFRIEEYLGTTEFGDFYVAHYRAVPEVEGENIAEKYRMGSVDGKYSAGLPKSDTISLGTAVKMSRQ